MEPHGHRADQCSAWPVGESGNRSMHSSIEKTSLGFTMVARVVKMSMPMTRAVLRLTGCDSAFLVVVSTVLIMCSVVLVWIIAPSLLRRSEGIVFTEDEGIGHCSWNAVI